MGNGLNVRRVTGYQVRQQRKGVRQVSIQKVRLNPVQGKRARTVAGGVSLTRKSLRRVEIMGNVQEAVLKVLEGLETKSKDVLVNQHQLKSLKSNPTANTSLNKKQMKKLRSRAMACGLIGKRNSAGKAMEL